jgi:hypothetical protein
MGYENLEFLTAGTLQFQDFWDVMLALLVKSFRYFADGRTFILRGKQSKQTA